MHIKRIKVTNVLVFINIIVIIVIMSFYLTRMVKFYLKENKEVTIKNQISLFEYIKSKESYVNLTNGLVYDEDSKLYIYKGNVENNYIKYSGILYRILSTDPENNIRIVTDKSVTLLYPGLNRGFKDSYINKWLNIDKEGNYGVYEKNMYSASLLNNTFTCEDEINDIEEITCNEYNNAYKINLLSLHDYNIALGEDGFLNNSENYVLNTTSKDGIYYVDKTGEIGVDSAPKAMGIRPVITINGEAILIEGDGSKDFPYIVESHSIYKLKDAYVGEYVLINKELFKIINIEDGKILIASNNLVKDENNESVKVTYKNIDKELTNISSTLKEDFILNGEFYIGKYTYKSQDYSLRFSDKKESKVGLLSLGDLFINDVNDTWLYNKPYENDLYFSIDNNGNVYKDLSTSVHGIRYAFYVDSNTNISKGEGTEESPYELVLIKEEE